jgi:hypothetical protein
MAHK